MKNALLVCFSLLSGAALVACEEELTPAGPSTEPPPDCSSRAELTDAMFAGGTTLESGTCWTVNEALRLDDGTVTIEEGVSIWFATDIRVEVFSGGQLRIAGTEDAPVELGTADPLVSWQGIRLEASQGSSNVWEHVVIGNAGSRNWTGAAYSAAAVYLNGSTTLSMDHVTIAESRAHGLLATEDVSFSFANGAFIGTETPAYVHPEVAHGIGGETTFTDNTNAYVSVVFGNTNQVATDQTWAALAVPYRVHDRFYVRGGELTIAPGTTLEFTQGASLIVDQDGGLVVEGTEEAPITFRATSAGTRGYWQGIRVAVGGTDAPLAYGATFDHVVIEDAGGAQWTGNARTQAALFMDDPSSALITNTTFRNSGGYGLWASDDARIEGFGGNTFEGNARVMLLHPDRVGELSGTSSILSNDRDTIEVVMSNTNRVSASATWKNMGVPYEITDRFYVAAPLTVEAGAQLVFAQDVRVVVEAGGSLKVDGTAEEPVTFSGVEAVDTGYWAGLQFLTNSPDNALTYATVQHTGSVTMTGDSESNAAVYVESGASVALSDVTIGPGGGYGVYVADDSSSVTCSSVAFVGMEDGAVWDDVLGSILGDCT